MKQASLKRISRRAVLLAMLALAPALSGHARASETAHEKRSVGSFTALSTDGSTDIVLTQGDTDSVVVEGDPDDVKNILTTVRDGVLLISTGSRFHLGFSWSNDSDARVLITTKTLSRISSRGSGDMRCDSWIEQGSLSLSVSGSSDVRFNTLAAKSLDVAISGSGDVTLAGGVYDLSVSIAGSGDFRGAKLQTSAAKISIAGSGDASVWARDRLSVSIAGSGDVSYYGDPHVSKSILGSGSVTHAGSKN